MTLPDISTPDARARFQHANRQGAPVFDWLAAETGASWRQSRASGVAVVIHPTVCRESWRESIRPVPSHYTAEGWYQYRLDSQRRENDRRDFATLEVCLVVLMGYIEGRDLYARRFATALGSRFAAMELAYDSVPSYTEMRNFLEGELDARPVIAAAAAFRQRSFHNKLEAHHRAEHYGGRDRVPDTGWL